MVHISAFDVSYSEKPANWTIVRNKKVAKKVSYIEELPALVKRGEELKRKIFYNR